jgi:hypothetical protein
VFVEGDDEQRLIPFPLWPFRHRLVHVIEELLPQTYMGIRVLPSAQPTVRL